MRSIDDSDRAAPPSLARSDCSSISAADFDAFTPRPEAEAHLYAQVGDEGDMTPRLPAALGVAPQFSLQPYLKSYALHSHIKASLLEKSSGRSSKSMEKRPISAPVRGGAAARDVIIINGMLYVPAGPVAAPSDVDALNPRPRSAALHLKLSRTFTDFSSPSKGPMEVGSPERQQNMIRTRPWTAQPVTRPWEQGVNPRKEQTFLADDAAQSPTGSGASSRTSSSRSGQRRPSSAGPSALAHAAKGPRGEGSRDAAQEFTEETSPAAKERGQKRPSSAGFTQLGAPAVHDRRRPSSALPTSGGGHQKHDDLGVGEAQILTAHERPSSATVPVHPSPAASIYATPATRRPASANRIRFEGEHGQPPRHHHYPLHAGGGGADDGMRAVSVASVSNLPVPSQSLRPSSATSRPSSATARRKMAQESESITSYSQDPIHPERMQVIYTTRTRQAEDSRMKIQYETQYDDIAIDQDEHIPGEENWGLLPRAPSATSTRPSPALTSSRPSSAMSRPVSASLKTNFDPALSRMRPGTPQSARMRGGGAEDPHMLLSRYTSEPLAALQGGGVAGRAGGAGGGRDAQNLLARYDSYSGEHAAAAGGAAAARRTRPSTAPGGGAKRMAHEERWEHRMERIWEKRFASIRNTDGDTSQDSADSARSAEQEAVGARGWGQDGWAPRVRPRSASGVLVSGAGEVDEMRRQLRVIGDVARDLDTRIIHPHHTGIADEDEWLRKAQYESARVRRVGGSRSAACRVM